MSEPRTTSVVHAARAPGAVAAAVEALGQGLLVVIPTETVYGLACNAASPEAVARLGALTAGSRPSAWHAPSAASVRETLKLASPIHKRLVAKLLPGPVTLLVERSEDQLSRVRRRWGVAPGAMDDGKTISVRVPAHAAAGAVLGRALEVGMPVVAQGIGAAGWGDGRTLPDALRRGEVAGVGAVLDDGPTRLGRPSTSVRLLVAGGYRIEREGAMPAKAIQRLAQRTILFVCTGNTCRSPMAEAIARHELRASVPRADGMPAVPTNVTSAGASAYDGDGPTPETIQAIQSLGIDAAVLARHRSRALTGQMIADADVVYAMTAAHVRAALALSPDAADKIKILDPEGADIPDPIGSSLEVYTRTAQRLRELIRRRLAEAGGLD